MHLLGEVETVQADKSESRKSTKESKVWGELTLSPKLRAPKEKGMPVTTEALGGSKGSKRTSLPYVSFRTSMAAGSRARRAKESSANTVRMPQD
eukprot:3248014-Rhodomonas_salina.2